MELNKTKKFKIAWDISGKILEKKVLKNLKPIRIRDWFPVYHCGYNAIIGFRINDNEFFMSEPIISVTTCGRMLMSMRKLYLLEGKLSMKTYEIYDIYYENETIKLIKMYATKAFVNGLSCRWPFHIYLLNTLIVESHTICNNLKNVGNLNFNEILNPHCNYNPQMITEKESNMRNCLNNVFNLIQSDDQSWRNILIDSLVKNKFTHLIEKVLSFHISKLKSEKRFNKQEFQPVFLWTPRKRNETASSQNIYYINGFVYSARSTELIPFSADIVEVFQGGRNILTKSGLIKLVGPICKWEWEKIFNIEVFNRVLEPYLFLFFDCYPKYWQCYVTIIELVLLMDFGC